MLSYFNGIKLVSKYVSTLALEKSVFLFWLLHYDKSISSVVIRWCIFECPWSSICGWEIFIFYIFSPILDWSTQSAPRTEETWGNTHESSWSGAGLGCLRHNCAWKQNLNKRRKNMLLIKWIMHVPFHFLIPACGRCQTILRGQFRDRDDLESVWESYKMPTSLTLSWLLLQVGHLQIQVMQKEKSTFI